MRTSALLFTERGTPTERFARLLKDLQIPGTTLAEINDGLQAAFVQKKDSGEVKERWELEKVLVACPEHSIREQLGNLGFMYQTLPRRQSFDYAGWPGALVTRAAGRLLDLTNAWEDGVRWAETVVFGGKRELHKEKETRDACIAVLLELCMERLPTEKLAAEWDNLEPQTELDMMRWVWTCSDVPDDLRALPTVFVDAPMKPPATPEGKPVRPNTEDTILAWKKVRSPKPGCMLVSSGAPYGMAQNEAFWMLLGGSDGIEIETFGHVVPQGLGLEVILRELAGTVYRIKRAREGK